MKGIVIASHGNMAQGILDTSKLFFGEQEQMKAFCLQANDNPDDFVEVLKIPKKTRLYIFKNIILTRFTNIVFRIRKPNWNN